MVLALVIACASGTRFDTSASPPGRDTADEDTGGAPPALVINEVLASNAHTVTDATGRYPDYIELFNPTSVAVDLAGWGITDDLDQLDVDTLAALRVDAGGFLLLWADSDPAEGPDHLAFTLSITGECLALYAPGGVRRDALCFGQQATDLSVARRPDGADLWQIAAPTPGQTNGAPP